MLPQNLVWQNLISRKFTTKEFTPTGITTKKFDVVIPVHKRDLSILEYCIAGAKKNLPNLRKIYVVSKEKYTNNAEWFSEDAFPFSLDLVKDYIKPKNYPAGWYFQQLLKLYAPLIIPDILEDVLILDSDTVFYHKVKMFDGSNRPNYNISKDKITTAVFDKKADNHIKCLLPEISRQNLPKQFSTKSAVCHHMMFNRQMLQQLMSSIEKRDTTQEPFYKIFLRYGVSERCASEYQLYFNFVAILHRSSINIRKLRYKNTADSNIAKYRYDPRYHYCSFHHYLRHNKKPTFKIRNFLANKIRKICMVEDWAIGVVQKPIAEFINIPNQEITWIKTPYNNFYADPFGFELNNKKYILFEDYNNFSRLGDIKIGELSDDFRLINIKTIITGKIHFSYPFVFNDNNKLYFICEAIKSSSLALYELQSDFQLSKVRDIFTDQKIIDPTILRYDSKWWIFYTTNDRPQSKLRISWSDSLLGEFKQHKLNPIKEDITSSRSAGGIFIHNGNLYRPTQNCTTSYGGSITINKIIKLSTEEYCEEVVTEITPNQFGKYPVGIHTISALGDNLTLVDGRRLQFNIYKPLLSLIRKRLTKTKKSSQKPLAKSA